MGEGEGEGSEGGTVGGGGKIDRSGALLAFFAGGGLTAALATGLPMVCKAHTENIA